MNAACQVPQFLQRELDLAVRLVDHRRHRVVGLALQELLLRETETHGQIDQPGLRPVVQIALDAPQVGGGRVDDDAPVRLELLDPPLQLVGGESSARTIARSALPRPRAMNGSTGHSTNRPTSVSANVSTAHGNRITSYSTVRQPTGSLSPVHSQPKKPPARRTGSGLGSSMRTPSNALARPRSALPSSRAPLRPAAISGSPITVTVSPAPRATIVTAYTNPKTDSGKLLRR